jgi:hypothetical protein
VTAAHRVATLRVSCPAGLVAPCAGRVVLLDLRRGELPMRYALARAAASTGSTYRIAPGRSASVDAPIDAAVARAVRRGRHPRLLALLEPLGGGGGASEAVVWAARR